MVFRSLITNDCAGITERTMLQAADPDPAHAWEQPQVVFFYCKISFRLLREERKESKIILIKKTRIGNQRLQSMWWRNMI